MAIKQVFIYTRQTIEPGKVRIDRHNIGFNYHELLGLLEEVQLDMLARARSGIEPDVVRTVTCIEKKEGQ